MDTIGKQKICHLKERLGHVEIVSEIHRIFLIGACVTCHKVSMDANKKSRGPGQQSHEKSRNFS